MPFPLQVAHLPGEEGAVIEQPGEHMHDPGGRLEPLAFECAPQRQVDRHQLGRRGDEGRTHLIGEHVGLAVEFLDDQSGDIDRVLHEGVA